MDFDIMGQGIHTNRYREALSFYPGEHSLCVNDHRYYLHDTIIVAEPYYLSKWTVLHELLDSGFSGRLVIEKMPFLTLAEFEHFLHMPKKFKVYFALLRLYEKKYDWAFTSKCNIEWPNLYSEGMDLVKHTLPNVFLFLIRQFGIQVINECVWERVGEGIRVSLKKNSALKVFIYNTSLRNAKVRINGCEINWPNYINLIWSMIDDICNETYDENLTKLILTDIMKSL